MAVRPEAAAGVAQIRFRLIDGTDIGPKSFPLTTLVSAVKEAVLADWPHKEARWQKPSAPHACRQATLCFIF